MPGSTFTGWLGVTLGAGMVIWGVSMAVSCFREYLRSRTALVEIVSAVELESGVSYRFAFLKEGEGAPEKAEGEATGSPRRFMGRDISVGDVLKIDYDPGYPGFIYPPGKYPVCRLWPLALAGFAFGTILICSGITVLN
ncbi:hypothetical protein [Streptomyces barkulensis]|uniref:hypothetical protein n=1 Tax=Streptomyces barkulensis TaxID=1257026 RepID=UPI00117EB054|nr:hypothetical protein [Streptomyces barkulensis]